MSERVTAPSRATNQPFTPLRWEEGCLLMLDQTQLPSREEWLRLRTPDEVADAIRRLVIRGAPAIGVAAAYGLVLALRSGGSAAFAPAAELLLGTRPTAVNLSWAIDQGRKLYRELADRLDDEALAERFRTWASELHRQDIEINRTIGRHGVALFRAGDRVLTHCNAGALATGGYGTAIGVVEASWHAGRLASVWVDETRPLLQGARLTSWELKRLGIPFRLVTDNSVGALMTRGLVDRIVVGADRIAANGDVANKIGTYTVAVLAYRHGVPFYVAAPRSTIDLETASGADIPIEERAEVEVTEVFGTVVAPENTPALNLAFDVTPADLVTAIVTEVGVLEPPYGESIRLAFERARC